ncbi:hypothetical protein B5E84_07260 [Lachnoclostridium sp. An14]|uniref:YgjV family protein n=1 Tax=Lachnoclostridium sp. An14 TaxID=1965562 RepID=UPI000B36DE5D|nr:YgjV family protein [Lachnoclostridium sp. An14]OUQ19078.1 hypothetical protein B5E84_07260 [Lachnoclostridium sp. An14]
MNLHLLIELFGYLGSVLVVISMLMTSVMKLRIINTIGSTIFATYALIIHSYPTALMNFCLVLINLYNMRKLSVNGQTYTTVELKPDDAFLQFFISHYREDILKYFPDFTGAGSADRVFLTLCGDSPAGVSIGHYAGETAMHLSLDYSTPMYRDCSVASHLYQDLKNMGIQELIGDRNVKEHTEYLKKMGYRDDGGVFRKTL